MTLGSEWKVKTDRWVRCEDGAWVRWSSVIAVETLPAHETGRYEVIFSQVGYRRVYGIYESRKLAEEIAETLFKQLDGDYG